MFHPDGAPAVSVRPACDVAGGIDVRCIGLEIAVHDDSPVECQARSFCQMKPRTYTHAHDCEINLQACAILEDRPPRLEGAHGISQMKMHAFFLMQSTN